MYKEVFEALGLNENQLVEALEDKKYAIKSYQNFLNDHMFKFGKCTVTLNDDGSILNFWRNKSTIDLLKYRNKSLQETPDFELPIAGVEIPYIIKTLTDEVLTRYF